MPSPTIVQRAEALIKDTKQNIESQQEVVAGLERRGLDATTARRLLHIWEEALVRRIDILSQIRERAQAKVALEALELELNE